ncbi:acyl-CoA thioester hydrolase [Spirosomataceae bacterium TFI 002]|nr:acyl-CoA thioester hydrolase [Spirosomataceae bacterium TFI 002]
MFQFQCDYRVRYADVDQMGYMYYGNYAKLYEIGRVEALRDLGIRYKDLETSGVMMPVYENKSKFLFPAGYDELLTIKVTMIQLPSTRMIFTYEITDEAGKLLHTGETTLVFIHMESNKITRCPSEIVDALRPFFEHQ